MQRWSPILAAAISAALLVELGCARPAPTVCGDGFYNPATEDCDDGNVNPGDGCSPLCTIEGAATDAAGPGTDAAGPGSDAATPGTDAVAPGTDAFTPGTDAVPPGTDAAPGFACGNGIVEPGETCDDGDATGGDGCSAACVVEPMWACTGMPSTCTMTGTGAPLPTAAGDLVITEIMRDPTVVTDANGEWFEVYNPTAGAFEMMGLTVQDDGTDSITIATSLVIAAGGYVVIGRSTNPMVNGGIGVDYGYGTAYSLANSSDEVEIRNGATTIDRVAYVSGTWPSMTGAALSLSSTSPTASANDLPGAWCNATLPYGGGVDLGTPGLPNPACP